MFDSGRKVRFRQSFAPRLKSGAQEDVGLAAALIGPLLRQYFFITLKTSNFIIFKNLLRLILEIVFLKSHKTNKLAEKGWSAWEGLQSIGNSVLSFVVLL